MVMATVLKVENPVRCLVGTQCMCIGRMNEFLFLLLRVDISSNTFLIC